MKPETKQLLEETKQRLFESDEFKVSREHVQWVQPNSGEPDDLDTLLDRIDRFAPSMQRWADSFNEPLASELFLLERHAKSNWSAM